MTVLHDFEGREIRLTDERMLQNMEHPEMRGQEARIAETLLAPDVVIASWSDQTVHIFHKLYDQIPVTRKFLVVIVKYLDNDAFAITAFFTDREKKGRTIWPQ